jgi:polyhydroxyalkanoate synthesis regulator phasin
MFGVSESREPIKGEFAKKLIEEVIRMLKNKDGSFKNKEHQTTYNIIQKDTLG